MNIAKLKESEKEKKMLTLMSNILIKYDLCGLSFTRQATPQHFFDHMALRSAAYI